MCPLVQRNLVQHLSVGSWESLRAEFIRRLFLLVVKESGYRACHFCTNGTKDLKTQDLMKLIWLHIKAAHCLAMLNKSIHHNHIQHYLNKWLHNPLFFKTVKSCRIVTGSFYIANLTRLSRFLLRICRFLTMKATQVSHPLSAQD